MDAVPPPEVRADHPVAPILARLHRLYPKLIDLSLVRIERLLAALEHPERRLPPVIHVAGTNGKGSTCAFLRAIGEAAGWHVHVTTSPHLIRVNERFRIAGHIVSDEQLTDALLEVEQVNGGAPITVFEVLVAAGYLLFSRSPADICVVEVGLGGRFDATNVIAAPACSVITSISLDHQEFLGHDLARIAWEKAGIMKSCRPVVTGAQPASVAGVLRSCATETGARLLERGQAWDVSAASGGVLLFRDASGTLELPPPNLAGTHQIENAGLAIAALRASDVGPAATAYAGIARAQWPARLQRLHGRLASLLLNGAELWLDGGHNEGAARRLAEQLEKWRDRPRYLVVGMKQRKEAEAFFTPLLRLATASWAVCEPGQHLGMTVEAVIAASGGQALPGPDLLGALHQIATRQPGRVLICGSLYLAGEVLKADGTDLLP